MKRASSTRSNTSRKNHILNLDDLPPPRGPAQYDMVRKTTCTSADPGGGLTLSSNFDFQDFENLEADPCLKAILVTDDAPARTTIANESGSSSGDEGDVGYQPLNHTKIASQRQISSSEDEGDYMLLTIQNKEDKAATSIQKVAMTKDKKSVRDDLQVSRTRVSRNLQESPVYIAKACDLAATKAPQGVASLQASCNDALEESGDTKSRTSIVTNTEDAVGESKMQEEDRSEDMHGVTPLEGHMLKLLDRDIYQAEEQELLDNLDKDILLAEEHELLESLGSEIREASVKSLRNGGMVIFEFDPRQQIPDEILRKDEGCDMHNSVEMLAKQMNFVRSLSHASNIDKNSSTVWDVDNMGNDEYWTKKELPKYIGTTREVLLTTRTLQGELDDNFCVGADEAVVVNVSDKEDDPHTIIVEVRGRQRDVDKAKRLITRTVREKQLRYVSLTSGLASNQTGRNRVQERNQQQYLQFQSKYQPMKDIEFGDINGKTVISSMWKQHKDCGFGNSCNAACPCFMNLDKLTSTVLDDATKKQRKKNPDYQRPKVIGFATEFAKKFMPLLKKEFPHEINEDLFARLVLMWGKHVQQQRFGTSCKPDCSCLEGWSSVFFKGRLEAPEVASEDAVQKERPNLPDAITRRSSSAESRGAPFPSKQQRPYEVDFDTRSQLGFFVMTKKRGSSSVCKIFSVNSRGTGRDSRLCPETIISHASCGMTQNWHCIDSHNDLMKLYEECKESFSSIRIRFINTDVKKGISRCHGSDSNWTSNLSWKGKPHLVGWAGGASLASSVLREIIPKAKGKPHSEGQNGDASFGTAGLRDVSPEINCGIDLTNRDTASNLSVSPFSRVTDEASTSATTVLAGRWIPASLPNVNETLVPLPTTPGKVLVPDAHSGTLTASDIQKANSESSNTQSKWHVPTEPNHRGGLKPTSILRDVAPKKPIPDKDSLFRNLAGRPKKRDTQKIRWNIQLEDTRVFSRSLNFGNQKDGNKGISETLESPARQVAAIENEDTSNAALLTVIKTKSCVDVLNKLLAGARPRPIGVDVKDKKLQPELVAKKNKESRESIHKTENSKDSRRQVDDARMKIALLKMFEKLQTVADSSMAFKRWGRYECKIDRIEDFFLTEPAQLTARDKIVCQVSIKGFKCGDTAAQDYATEIKYSEGSGSHCRYAFFYNPTLSRDDKFVLTLQKFTNAEGFSKLPTERVDLAMEEIDLRKLAEESMKGEGYPVEITPTKYVKSARAVMIVDHKVKESKARMVKERENCLRQLYEILNDIEQFNGDHSRESLGLREFDVNLANPINPHITLLHAALYLSDIIAIRKLVRMGAQSNVKVPTEGLMTPRELALFLFSEKKVSSEILRVLQIKPEEYEESDFDELCVRDLPKSSSANLEKAEALAVDQLPSLLAESSEKQASKDSMKAPGSEHPYSNWPVGSGLGSHSSHKPNESAIPGMQTQEPVTECKIEAKRLGLYTAPGTRRPVILGKRERSTEDQPWQSRKAPRRESINRDLPDISIENLISGRTKCRYFDKDRGCKRGKACKFAHVRVINPLGIKIQQIQPKYRSSDLRIEISVDKNNLRCCTAIYWDREQNVFLQAIKGKTIGKNVHGIYWYAKQEDAINAVEDVIVLWQNPSLESTWQSSKDDLSMNNFVPSEWSQARDFVNPSLVTNCQSSSGSSIVPMPVKVVPANIGASVVNQMVRKHPLKYLQELTDGRPAKYSSRKTTPSSEACSSKHTISNQQTGLSSPQEHCPQQRDSGEAGTVVDDTEMKAFCKLVNNANHSATYAIFAGRPLAKDDWMLRFWNTTWVNASFTAVIGAHIPPTTFHSAQHGDAKQYKGKWYHQGVREAKASAFLEFLKFLQHTGMLYSLDETIDRYTLPYAR